MIYKLLNQMNKVYFIDIFIITLIIIYLFKINNNKQTVFKLLNYIYENSICFPNKLNYLSTYSIQYIKNNQND